MAGSITWTLQPPDRFDNPAAAEYDFAARRSWSWFELVAANQVPIKMTHSQADGTHQWDLNAERWHSLFGENDPNRRDLLDPIILRLLGNPAGMRVLDAGCGDGYLCRKLAKLGAQMTGVECSARMLSFALESEKADLLAITYFRSDIASLSFMADATFDAIVTNNVIQDTANYLEAFDGFKRIVKLGGKYIHIVNHPCFSTPTFGWVKDADGNKLYRKVDRYFDRGSITMPWGPKSGMESTIFWHRTLSDQMNALISRGFRIDEVIEPEPPRSWYRDHPERLDAARIPDFLVLSCTREDRPGVSG